ncbi:MAG: Gfo/Idh/MocA family protein [Pirellulales bacterium]
MQRDRIPRRRVLKTGAAALGVPYLVASSALGADEKPAANDRLTIGQIGCGSRGNADMRGLVAHGAEMVAACDCYESRRRKVAEGYKCKPYADFRDLLARDDIDCVLIATPEHWHATMSIEACRAGKDVYCEKPLTYTIEEAAAVLATAQRYDRVFQVGTQQRSDPRYRFACELVRNGYIGEVKRVLTEPGGTSRPCELPPKPVPKDLDWNMWLGPAPWAPYHPDRCRDLWRWWKWRDYSGGLMTDRGAHDFDIVQWGLGMDGSGPHRVIPPKPGSKDPLRYIYPGDVEMHAGQGGWGASLGPGASVVFEGTKGKVHVWRGGIKTEPGSLAKVKIKPDEVHLMTSRNHQGNFLDSVRARQRSVADVSAGASSVTVCHIGNIAYWLDRPLTWDPAEGVFAEDDQANRYLHRPMREPWRL